MAGLIPHLRIKRKKSSSPFNLAVLALTNILFSFSFVYLHAQNILYILILCKKQIAD